MKDDLINRQAALEALDEINAEVEDGYGFDFEKWREFFCDLPSAQPDVTDKNVGDMMSRLDTAISNAAYILDALMAYRNIVDSGDCNRCGKKKICEYVPNLGQLVRYNCPFYEQEGEG